MKKLIVLTLLALLSFSGCTQEKKLTKYSNQTVEAGFDTVMTLIGYTESQSSFDKYFELMKTEYTRLNQLYDKYNDYAGVNNIKTINDNAGKQAVKVDKDIIDMLVLARSWTEPSKGSFNVTLGAVLEIWHNYRTIGQSMNQEGLAGDVPEMSVLQAANQFTGWQYVVIDESASTVFLTSAGTRLDVGGIGKGFATEIVAQKLEAAGLSSGIVNGGGNVRIIGKKPTGEKWGVGIQAPDPTMTADSLDTLYTDHSMSVVTSGDYQRYYLGPNDIVLHHLIDPSTLMPATQARSVTIMIKNSGLADALAKPLYILPYAEAIQFLNDYNTAHPDDFMGAVWVYDLGKQPTGVTGKTVGNFYLVYSENIKQYSRLNTN